MPKYMIDNTRELSIRAFGKVDSNGTVTIQKILDYDIIDYDKYLRWIKLINRKQKLNRIINEI